MDQGTITIKFTSEQQKQIYTTTGFVRRELSLSTLEAIALSLAGAAAGTDVLPVSMSSATITQILSSDKTQPAARLLPITLTEDQREQLKGITGLTLSTVVVAPDEWNTTYNEDWTDQPSEIRIGKSLRVVYGAPKHESPNEVDIILPIQNSEANHGVFGTGRHPVTRLSLELVESFVRPGDCVLDLGTGSGILAIAAARMGAHRVLALDNDVAAIVKAKAAVLTNNFEGTIEAQHGSIELAAGSYDVVLANIFPQVILNLASSFRDTVRPAGTLIVSGIVSARVADVSSRLNSFGFELSEQRSEEIWSALAFRRSAA
jgi:ribosomal protein L11 methyltransferase